MHRITELLEHCSVPFLCGTSMMFSSSQSASPGNSRISLTFQILLHHVSYNRYKMRTDMKQEAD